MAITNYAVISADDWNAIKSNYTQIVPLITSSGTTDPNLNVSWYVNNSDNTSFAIAISSSGQESLMLWNADGPNNKLKVDCTTSPTSQGWIYHTLKEDQGWTSNFNVELEINNTNSAKGKWTFTKGKGGNRPK